MGYKTTQPGFTLVELIAVIIILGLVSVAILPRFIQANSTEIRTVQDKLINVAREAQQLAMSKPLSANVQLIIDNTNKRLRIQYTEGGTQTLDTDLPSSTSITSQTLAYNKNGYLTSGSPVDISINGGARTVRIEASGYAHAL